MITATTWRTGIDRGNHCFDFFRFEVCDGRVIRPFATNRQYAPVLAGTCYVVSQKVLHEAADRRETTVPRHGGVPALGFDVAQEGQHSFGLNVVEIQIRD